MLVIFSRNVVKGIFNVVDCSALL